MIAAGMAKHLATELADLIYDADGTTGNVFLFHMPSTPDLAVMVETSGGGRQGSRMAVDEPTLHVIVRGAAHDPRTPYDLARDIYSELACLDLVTVDDGGADEFWLAACTPAQTEPVPMGQDENRRHEWSMNFELQVEAPTLHRV